MALQKSRANAFVSKEFRRREHCCMFQADGLVLIVHTHNAGYSGCKQVRQLLVARPGQKPCAWVSFDSLRSSLLSWHGYALMAVTHRQDALLVQSASE